MIRYIHGSPDSLDNDVIYVSDKIMSRADATQFCAISTKEENRNVIYVEDGVCKWCYKGSPDEVNNALFDTYGYHDQEYDLIIKRRLPRDVYLKAIRVVRGIISYASRTSMRGEVKRVLKSPYWQDRVDFINAHDLYKIEDFVVHDLVEVRKFYSFQLGQLDGLFDGIELYTKSYVGYRYNELKGFLQRDPSHDISNMAAIWQLFKNHITSDDMIEYTQDKDLTKM